MNKVTFGIIALAACTFASSAFAGEPPIQVPEPGTLGLLALGLAGVAAARLTRRK